MSTSVDEAVQQDPEELPVGPFRPARRAFGPGPFFRRIAGIREEILDWVPEERGRYARLGAIVVNTGLIAGLSLFVALRQVVDVFWVALVPIAMFWAFLVVSFDSWLIASTHGMLSASRLKIFIPRLVISVLMGAVIAEPLVLWVFAPAVHKQVLDDRRDQLSAYESQWKACNPVTGSPPSDVDCGDFHVNIDTPDAAQQKAKAAHDERDALQNAVKDIRSQLAAKEQVAQNECSGTAGPGTTGVRGDGPDCKRDRQTADQFRVDSRLDQREADLTKLNQQVVELDAAAAEATRTYGQRVTQAIADKVQAKEADQGIIGLLDEDRALGELSSHSAFVFAGQWLLRLLLIAIDCLPVLAKLLGGVTSYDQLLSRQLEVDRRLHDRYMGVREQRDNARSDVRMMKTEHDRQSRMEEIEDRNRDARAAHEAEMEDRIDELARRLRGD